ncbi:unnamed protein product, partial [Pylaiella littoralis]
LKAGNNGFCARHARQGDSRDDEDEDVGDEGLSDDGSEAEYPGDLGDHDGSGECQLTKATATKIGRDRGIAKVKEPWAKRALSYMWGLREATVELE